MSTLDFVYFTGFTKQFEYIINLKGSIIMISKAKDGQEYRRADVS